MLFRTKNHFFSGKRKHFFWLIPFPRPLPSGPHSLLSMKPSGSASASPEFQPYLCWYVSFGQGSSLLWTHTLRPFYSRPIALTQEGRSLVNDVYTGRARFMLMRSDISQHWHVIGGISRISGLWSPCPKSEYPFTHVYLLNVTAEYEYTCFSVIFRNFWRGMVLRSLQRTPACHCVTACAISRKVIQLNKSYPA